MNAITLKQPWASLVMHLLGPDPKRVENRSKPPPATVIGKRIAIHAGKSWDRKVPKKHDRALLALADRFVAEGWQGWPFGCVLGTVVIENFVRRRTDFNFAEPQMRWYVPGNFGLLLGDVRRLKVPIRFKGALGYWTVPPMIEAALDVLPEEEGLCWGRGR